MDLPVNKFYELNEKMSVQFEKKCGKKEKEQERKRTRKKERTRNETKQTRGEFTNSGQRDKSIK